MGIMFNLYSYTFLAFKDYLNRRRIGKQVYQDVMEGRRAPAAYTHPEVAHLEPQHVNELAQIIREDLPELKQDDEYESYKYRAMDGNMIYLRKRGNIDIFNPSNKGVADFDGVSFFEKYYNDDPRQTIDDMEFNGKTEPEKGIGYTLEDGNILAYDPSEDNDLKIGVYLPNRDDCCAFANLECFFRYYKLHETKDQQPQQPQENMVKKYCTSCGAELPMAALFCGKCGANQNVDDIPKKEIQQFEQEKGNISSDNVKVNPDVADLNPNSIEEIADMMRGDLERVLNEKTGVRYQALDGNKVCLDYEDEGGVMIINPDEMGVIYFTSIDFFEKYYNDDPRRAIDPEGPNSFDFDGNHNRPQLNVDYPMEDGNVMYFKRVKSGAIALYIMHGEEDVGFTFDPDLENFYRYYKLIQRFGRR